jgi:hypothetical protein
MMTEEDKKLVQEAKNCDSCLQWHKYCKAECCSVIFLKIPVDVLDSPGKFISIQSIIKLDERWYYRLRGVEYAHGMLRFRKKNCVVLDNRVAYIRKCDLLTDNLLCKNHGGRRPHICEALTIETAKQEGKYFGEQRFKVTEHCLFKYKNMGDEENEEKS